MKLISRLLVSLLLLFAVNGASFAAADDVFDLII